MLWLPALLFACTAQEPPGRLLVIQREPDGTYALAARERGNLDDPRRLEGDIGQGRRGGQLTTVYKEGGQLDIRWTVDQGEAVPTDEQGLVMWSFWYHLTDAIEAVAPFGHDPSPILPVNIAWSPQSLLDLQAVENAAFVLGQRTFMLFPDALDNVPIAANAGVVRHEFGHAFFELLTTGESGGKIPWLEESTQDSLAVGALNEGFADMVATLTLDDPRFIDASLVQPSRDVSDDWVATSDLYPDKEADLLDAVGGYDKYALGTVYASFVWDVREATDPDTAMGLAIEALVAYGEAGEWGFIDGFVLAFIELARGQAKDAACASAAVRFPELDISEVCS